eukprot:scaffold100_cov357-Prasinococcus_capsulatus_cf.AAC.6
MRGLPSSSPTSSSSVKHAPPTIRMPALPPSRDIMQAPSRSQGTEGWSWPGQPRRVHRTVLVKVREPPLRRGTACTASRARTAVVHRPRCMLPDSASGHRLLQLGHGQVQDCHVTVEAVLVVEPTPHVHFLANTS